MAKQTTFIRRTYSMDEETARRAKGMARDDDRSESALVRVLINREYANRRRKQATTVSDMDNDWQTGNESS